MAPVEPTLSSISTTSLSLPHSTNLYIFPPSTEIKQKSIFNEAHLANLWKVMVCLLMNLLFCIVYFFLRIFQHPFVHVDALRKIMDCSCKHYSLFDCHGIRVVSSHLNFPMSLFYFRGIRFNVSIARQHGIVFALIVRSIELFR